MNENRIPEGVWPTMLTLFREDRSIDYQAMEKLIEWYIGHGVHGLFAVCQSSEMFQLSLNERVELARFTVKQAAGRLPVIASGHISDHFDDQVEEIKRISETGIEAFILVSNRLADVHESDEIFQQRIERIMEAVPNIRLGIYECPYPYQKRVSTELLTWLGQTGRFHFFKDTCSDVLLIKSRLEALKGSPLKLFNANATTLLQSYLLGAAGYSGIMTNFHPELYVWLHNHWESNANLADELHAALTVMLFIDKAIYPINAKYYLQLEGITEGIQTRAKSINGFGNLKKMEMEHLLVFTEKIRKEYTADS